MLKALLEELPPVASHHAWPRVLVNGRLVRDR